MSRWTRLVPVVTMMILLPLVVVSAPVSALPPSITISVHPGTVIMPDPSGSPSSTEFHAVISVSAGWPFSDDTVEIESTQLYATCPDLSWETLQGATTNPLVPLVRTGDHINVDLDNNANATLVANGYDCISAIPVELEVDLEVPPYSSAPTTLNLAASRRTAVGVTADPTSEIETGDTAPSGGDDVYTAFAIQTPKNYRSMQVAISSPALASACGGGIRWESDLGSTNNPSFQASVDAACQTGRYKVTVAGVGKAMIQIRPPQVVVAPGPYIEVSNVSYPTTGTGTEEVDITGQNFTPRGQVWVGVNPLTSELTYCGGPGQGGWCALRTTADKDGGFTVTISVADVSSGCPPDIRVDATDLTTNIGSNEVTSGPGFCIT